MHVSFEIVAFAQNMMFCLEQLYLAQSMSDSLEIVAIGSEYICSLETVAISSDYMCFGSSWLRIGMFLFEIAVNGTSYARFS